MARLSILSEQNQDDASLKITPLIDVIFLLLIFFIATMEPPKEEAYLSIKMSGAGSADLGESGYKPYPIHLTTAPKGELVLDGLRGRLSGFDTLADELEAFKALGASAPDPDSFSRATLYWTPEVEWRHLVKALESCKQAQITQVGFQQQAENQP